MKKIAYATLLIPLIVGAAYGVSAQANQQTKDVTTHQAQDSGSCYQYLTELVRSSNFPFRYVKKDKANLLLDNDSGDEVTAQLFFDTNGSGVIGWVNYKVGQRLLYNISADVDEPQSLTFDKAFAEKYEKCIKHSAPVKMK
ncbi:hypothetical protein ACIQVE_28935 [Pseudomonas sp. NPDC098747]|uniref:hypothetical protein n=1 Tax=Pseudomonas sp. NPDC098747 TaxID=3364487 RepID=UPI00383ACF9D